MRAVITRVTSASVTIDGAEVSAIGHGLLVLLGIAVGDTPSQLAYMASKIRDLRIFPDDDGRMNRSVLDVGGAVMVVSQFTLLADVRRGRRPSFVHAAPPEEARAMYDQLVNLLRNSGLPVSTGVFQADMQVSSINDGPVTIVVDATEE